MADYCTATQINVLWSAAATAPAGIVARCIAKAQAMIDGAISNRYTLPFANVPPLVTSICEDLTVYLIKRALNPGVGKLDDETESAYADVKDTLKSIAGFNTAKTQEVINLVDASGNVIAPKDTMSSSSSSYIQIFNLDDWENQGISEVQEDAIEDERDSGDL